MDNIVGRIAWRMEDLEILIEGSDRGSTRFMVIREIISSKILYRKGVLNILRNIWTIEVALMITKVGANMYSLFCK